MGIAALDPLYGDAEKSEIWVIDADGGNAVQLTKNGVADDDGCPDGIDGDRDHDGIVDSKDKRPDEPEDKDNFFRNKTVNEMFSHHYRQIALKCLIKYKQYFFLIRNF